MKWLMAVFLITVSMAIAWAATAPIPPAAVSIDAAVLKFLPADTQGIVFIDVAALRSAPLIQDSLKSNKDAVYPRDWNEVITKTGIDPERDLDKVTIAKINSRDSLVIMQGRFDKLKVEQFLKSEGKSAQGYLGQTLYGEGDGSFALLDNIVLTGQTSAVKKALDQMQLPGSLPLRSDLMAAIQTIEAGNQVWGVGEFSIDDLGTVGVRGPAPVMDMMKTLRSGIFQLRVDSGIHSRLTGKFADAEGARNIGDLARGAIAIAKLQVAKQQPEMLQLLDGIQVSYTDTTLTVRIEETGEQLKKLYNLRTTIQKSIQ